MTDSQRSSRPLAVFVQLAHGFGGTTWRERWTNDQLLGINEDNAYGYLHAREMGCDVVQSEDRAESTIDRLTRLGARVVLGFDLVHTYRNRHALFAADVVWTHTESQSLAVAALLLIWRRRTEPRLIAQTVWLMDNWESYSKLRRAFYRLLIRRCNMITFHSSDAVDRAKRLFPGKHAECVRFGIKIDNNMFNHSRRPVEGPVRILSLGNDRHRDWKTLIEALAHYRNYEVKIVTSARLSRLLVNVPNVTIERPQTNRELMALYDWADCVVLCLSANVHASGITVIQEAVVQGIPVVCTDTGGLRSYFTSEDIRYTPIANPVAVREAIDELAADSNMQRMMKTNAISRMRNNNLDSRSFVRRHVELSMKLLGRQLDPCEPSYSKTFGERLASIDG